MNDTTTAAPAERPAAPAPAPAPVSSEPLTLKQATESFLTRRERGETAAPLPDPIEDETARTEQPRDKGRFASPQKSEPVEGEDAARPQDATGETQEADPAEKPPLELPRSWSKDKAEVWNALSRDAQEYLLDHDKTSSTETRRVQNEAAELRKAAEAERTAATQARTQYESAAQNALAVLQTQQAAEFGDIKTDADVMRLATDDPFRFTQWQARQMQIQNQARDVWQLGQQREQEKAETFKTWAQEQDAKFTKQFPVFADAEQGPKVRASVTTYLTKEIGVPEEALQKLWNTDLFRDAMWQRVVYEASRFHKAQQDAKSAVQAPKPQVQKPGTSSTKGERGQADIAVLSANLDNARGERAQIAAAAALRAAKRAAAH
jgi:hypothetical protein